jgi:hypothetical protein
MIAIIDVIEISAQWIGWCGGWPPIALLLCAEFLKTPAGPAPAERAGQRKQGASIRSDGIQND